MTMNAFEILAAVEQGEADDWEFKSARGGVPGSLLETYSAMANTQGGIIVLGVEQQEDSFGVSGVDNTPQKQKSIWDNLHNRKQVSLNLLSSSDVQVKPGRGQVNHRHSGPACPAPSAARFRRPESARRHLSARP